MRRDAGGGRGGRALAGRQSARNAPHARKRYRHPSDLVEAKARAVSRAQAVWQQARPQGDFAAFLPALCEVVERVREEARIKGEALGLAPYDALLDAYDPGRRSQGVTAMFAELEAVLPGVIDRVRGGAETAGAGTGRKTGWSGSPGG